MLLTVDEVADILRKSRWAVYRFIRSGALAASKMGDSWRVSREDLEDFRLATRNR